MSRPARKMYRATIERVSHTDTLTEQQLKVLAKSLRDWEGDELMQFVFDLQSLRRLAAQGATTLTLLQRLLKDPLGQIFAVEYDVTGTWDEPKVTRTKVESPAAQASKD